jgi:hypothetical protein
MANTGFSSGAIGRGTAAGNFDLMGEAYWGRVPSGTPINTTYAAKVAQDLFVQDKSVGMLPLCHVPRFVKRRGQCRHIREPLANLCGNFAAHKVRVYPPGSARYASRHPGQQNRPSSLVFRNGLAVPPAPGDEHGGPS